MLKAMWVVHERGHCFSSANTDTWNASQLAHGRRMLRSAV
jgi:hypothetical protein